jgi:excisionase family DNA binding protein
LSVRVAARRLGVSTATVYALCDAGTLAHVRVMNAIRIAFEDLAAFVRAHRSGGFPAAAAPEVRNPRGGSR